MTTMEDPQRVELQHSDGSTSPLLIVETARRDVSRPAILVLPGIAAGSALAWARALGEFGATITFAGSFPGRTQTAPLGVYAALEQDPDAALALSVVMLAVSVVVLGALRSRWLR